MHFNGIRHAFGNLALFLACTVAPSLALAVLGWWALKEVGRPIAIDALVPNNPEESGAILLAIFAFPTLFFAWRSLRQGRRMTRLSTRAQVVQKCIDRYEAIEDERIRALDAEPHRQRRVMDLFFRRYWALQSDQVDFYLAGWLDFDTLRSWVFGLCRRLIIDPEPGPQTMRESWKDLVATHDQANPLFASMVDAIYAFADGNGFADDDHHSIDAKIMALTDALFLIISQKTMVDREMLQRKYDVEEFLQRISSTRQQNWFPVHRLRELYKARLRRQGAQRGVGMFARLFRRRPDQATFTRVAASGRSAPNAR